MAEGSYWSNEFSCPTIAAFLQESVCENTEDVAGVGELVLDATDNGQWNSYSTVAEPWTINSKAMLPHPLLRLRAMLTRSQQRPRVATRPEGYRQPTTGAVPRLETVAKTAWHHSSYRCVRLVLVTINSSMQYATTQRQGPPAYIANRD